MSAEMDDLKADVAATSGVVASTVTFINGLADQIADAAGDRAASLALSAEVKSQAAALGAAIDNDPATP